MNDRLALIADAAGIGLWTRELDTGELFWSAANRALYGIGPDEPPPSWQEYLEHYVHPDDRQRFMAEVAQADVAGRPVQHEDYRVRTRDGRERWVYSWAAREVRDGRRYGFGVNVDVTDRHVAEMERRERERAEQARRAQSALLARVSHELRTPLNAMLGFAALLASDRQEPPSAQQTNRLEHIRQAGTHLLALIDDLLGLAAADADERPPDWATVDPARTIERALAWVQPLADECGVHLNVDAAATPGAAAAVRADARWLLQVSTNLLTNAIKYNRRGGWVRIGLAQRSAAGRETARIGIVVTDNGRGIDPGQRQRLFEPFERLGAEREGIAGSGIGLAIVRRLVERMGGEIEVTSDPGAGSEFRVWLVPADGAPPAVGMPTPAMSAAMPAASATAPAFDVLCIEDNAVNLELLVTLLGLRPQVKVRTAADGTRGLALAAERPPDLVLLDMHLPDLDGFAVLRGLRARDTTAGCRVIALSADALPGSAAAARTAGFDDYWTKPIDFARFLASIDALLAEQPLGALVAPD